MFWRKTNHRGPVEPATIVQEVSRSPEADIAQAILAYQRAFADTLRRSVNTDVENAKRLVARANKIVGESGLGPALAPILLDHVKYWPSWSKRDDFRQYVQIPGGGNFRFARGRRSEENQNEPDPIFIQWQPVWRRVCR
jgi:hypothetical protein